MDKFLSATGTSTGTSPTGQPCKASDVMNYYDGNTVTGLWNYAQHFAMSDNSFGTTFGPSAPGAINLVSGDTGGVDAAPSGAGRATDGDVVADGQGGLLTDQRRPAVTATTARAADAVAMTGTNIGDQLNAAGLSWGWFEGGFAPNTPYTGTPDTTSTYDRAQRGRSKADMQRHPQRRRGARAGPGQWGTKADYIPHHEPFEYYSSTANPHHLAPKRLSAVGTDTATPGRFNTANHQYDMSNFDALVAAIHEGTLSASHFPAVSFLKAPGYEDGHAAYSDPISRLGAQRGRRGGLERGDDPGRGWHCQRRSKRCSRARPRPRRRRAWD